MKKLFIFFICAYITINTDAQTTSGRVRWKSASNIYYNYTGELKNGKPHGRGFAISEDTGKIWIKVFGEFKDGMIDGSTVIQHSTGKIVVARWKENKPEGTGVIITPDEDMDYGNFVNGVMEGRVMSVHWDNKIVIDNIKNGKSNDRAIVITTDGKSMTDRLYVDGIPDGPGYQYEVEKKQKFEGIWAKGEWVKASTGNYPSFMRSPGLGSVETSEYIMIYSSLAKKDGREFHNDTCFVYDRIKNNRWFGYFDRGEFKSGIRLIGDSSRTIGQSGDKGNQGSCVWYKKGRVLQVGNYKDNRLEGYGVEVDINDSTIYDGVFSDGYYTGRAAMLMKNKEIRIGDFIKGKLEGEGKTIFPDGKSVSGKYEEGKLSFISIKQVTAPDGKKIDINPKDINTAINFLLKEWENNFMNINSGELSQRENEYYSWYNFPNGFCYIKADKVGIDGKQHNELSTSIDLEVFKTRTEQYNDLCKKLSACTITSLAKGRSLKLIPKINKLPGNGDFERIASFFTIPAYPGKNADPQIRVMVENKGTDNYILTVDIISKWK